MKHDYNLTDEQVEECVSAILKAMWFAESAANPNPLSMPDVSEGGKAERRKHAEAALEEVIGVVGMKNAMPDGFSHKHVVKAFRRGQTHGMKRREREYLIGVLMGACGGQGNPAEFGKQLDRQKL